MKEVVAVAIQKHGSDCGFVLLPSTALGACHKCLWPCCKWSILKQPMSSCPSCVQGGMEYVGGDVSVKWGKRGVCGKDESVGTMKVWGG
jgi:hypothetical protein